MRTDRTEIAVAIHDVEPATFEKVALVLSPLVKGGAVIDTALDHYDLLKTVALGLEVTPPGYASRKEVTGLPRETWATWEPSASATRR